MMAPICLAVAARYVGVRPAKAPLELLPIGLAGKKAGVFVCVLNLLSFAAITSAR